jgi:hypothetical protein
MMNGASYQQARQALYQILSEKEFVQSPEPEPWYVKLFRWVARHIHFSLSRGDIHTVAWVAGVLSVILLLVALTWWARRMSRSGQSPRVTLSKAHHARASQLELAEQALHGGDYRGMLHWLSETCLTYAARRGWIHYSTFKTARQYRRELQRSASPEFHQMYDGVAQRAEGVMFAGSALSKQEAEALFSQVKQCVNEDGV